MRRKSALRVLLVCGLFVAPAACTPMRESPGPDPRTAMLKSAEELAAERVEQVAAGQIQPGSGVVTVDAERRAAAATRPATPAPARPGSIHADILLVNDSILTAAEVLYPLWDRIEAARSGRALAEAVRRMVRLQAQQDVGIMLLYDKAVARLADEQKQSLDKAVERQFGDLLSSDFGGSKARFEAHLAGRGLTLEQFKSRLKRQLVAQEYAREELLPRVRISRADVENEFQRNAAAYSSAGTRELWMIEAPFEAFLDPRLTWENARDDQQAQARLRAVRQIRAAHDALRDRAFEDVAREFSRGVSAASGGSWGPIGEPLQPPLETATKLIFGYQSGQHSEPVETPIGWVIVRCGTIVPAVTATFEGMQERIRAELSERKFNELLLQHITELSAKATISATESFILATVDRALAGNARPTP